MSFASIFKKVFLALTGIAMILFLFGHLTGNVLLFGGPHKYNSYSDFLLANPLIVPVELILILILLVHLWLSLALTFENNAARPIAYDTQQRAGQSTFSSRTMIWTGLVVLGFLAFHIWQFKYGDKSGPHGLWGVVIRAFENPAVMAFYVVAMGALGLHLGHAIGSVFQTLGLRNASGHPRLRGISALLGWGTAIGFALLPITVFIAQPDVDTADRKPLIIRATPPPSETKQHADEKRPDGKLTVPAEQREERNA